MATDGDWFRDVLRLLRTYERLNMTVSAVGFARDALVRVVEIGGSDVGPEILEADARLGEMFEHLQSASRVLNEKIDLALPRAEKPE